VAGNRKAFIIETAETDILMFIMSLWCQRVNVLEKVGGIQNNLRLEDHSEISTTT